MWLFQTHPSWPRFGEAQERVERARHLVRQGEFGSVSLEFRLRDPVSEVEVMSGRGENEDGDKIVAESMNKVLFLLLLFLGRAA